MKCLHIYYSLNVLSRAEKLQLSEAVSQPICSTTECTQSAFKLLNALCNGSSENISTLHNLLTSYFYSGELGGGGGGSVFVCMLER